MLFLCCKQGHSLALWEVHLFPVSTAVTRLSAGRLTHSDHRAAWIGRKWTLVGFTIIFSVGAVGISTILSDVSVLILI